MRERVKITDYLFFQEGPGVRNTQYTTSGVKLLNVSNLVDGEIDLSNSDRYISNEEAYGKYKHFLVDEGDLIIASSGIKVDYLDKKIGFIKKEHLPLCMNTSTIRFKALDGKALNIKYFKYYLQSNDFKYQVSKNITGSAQLNYGPSHLKQMTFILYDLDEQNEIVERLDRINNLIQKHKEVINNLDTLIKARFVEMFGDIVKNTKNWKTQKLNEICGFNNKVGVDLINNKVWLLNLDMIESDSGKIIDYYMIDENEVPSSTISFNEKFVLYSKLRPYLNKVVIPIKSGYATSELIAIEPSSLINKYFLAFALRSKNFVDMMNLTSYGAKMPRASVDALKNFYMPLPDIEIQNTFAIFVNQVDKLKFDVQKSLEKTQMLFDSLMQEYFG